MESPVCIPHQARGAQPNRKPRYKAPADNERLSIKKISTSGSKNTDTIS